MWVGEGARADVRAVAQQDIDMFGHRFLLPFGRRHTQMEMDAAPVSLALS